MKRSPTSSETAIMLVKADTVQINHKILIWAAEVTAIEMNMDRGYIETYNREIKGSRMINRLQVDHRKVAKYIPTDRNKCLAINLDTEILVQGILGINSEIIATNDLVAEAARLDMIGAIKHQVMVAEVSFPVTTGEISRLGMTDAVRHQIMAIDQVKAENREVDIDRHKEDTISRIVKVQVAMEVDIGPAELRRFLLIRHLILCEIC